MFWTKKVEKYSLEHFQLLHAKLQSIKEVTASNQGQVIEILRMISELMIWGDQHNSLFFEFFVDKLILATYVNYIRGSNKEIQVQVIQALGILIANTKRREVTYYLLSNNHINQLISFPFDFAHTEELTAYYISFLKTLSNKLSLETIDFFFNQTTGEFPLFSEALKLASNPDTMVRIAVRTLSLNVFRLDHPPLRKHLTEHAVRPYFTNLALFLAVQFNEMNCALASLSPDHRSRLDDLVERHADWLHYMQDVFELKVTAFSDVLLECLLSMYLVPVLLPLLSADLKDPTLFASVGLSLFLLAQVFVTFDHALLVNALVGHLSGVTQLLTHPDERVVYYSMILVLAVLKCPATDKIALRQTGLLSHNLLESRPSQIRAHSRRLSVKLDEQKNLSSVSVWDSNGDDTLSTPRSVSELLADTPAEDTTLSNISSSPVSRALSDATSALDSCVIHSEQSTNFSPSALFSSTSSSSSSCSASVTNSNTSLSSANATAIASLLPPSSPSSSKPTPPDGGALSGTIESCVQLPYPRFVMESLLQLLSRMDSIQLGTLQLMCELVRELMMGVSARPCLPIEHQNLIQVEVKELVEFIKDQLQQGSVLDRVLDLIEDEVSLLGFSSTDLTNHKNLLPAPLTEGQLRRQIQQFMCTRKLLRDMLYSVPLLTISTRLSEGSDSLLVLLRQSNALVRGTCMEMDKEMKVIPCVCLQDNLNVFLLLHPELLLLVKKHYDPKLLSQAVVELAVPLKHQEAQQSPYNPNILLLKMKSERCPHPASQKIIAPAAAERERMSWSLSLVFTHQRHCLALVRHLKEARTRSRQHTLTSLLPLLDSDM